MANSYAIETVFSIIDRATSPLNKIGNAGDVVGKKLKNQFAAAQRSLDGLGATAKKASKMMIAGAGAAISAATIMITKTAIEQASELEQNLGGTSAVFGKYAQKVESLSVEAYKNMGLSASDYMATANKMGSLFQGSGLKQDRALELTTKAMQRASDVASVMGISQEMAMESIAGAAKGNFTMMDNLGVAMNATTLDAYAASKGMNFVWKEASNAEKAELAMKMFFERTQQYAGNFAREAADTYSGSLGAMKTAWQNLLGNMALGRDIKPSLDALSAGIQNYAKNLVPMIVNVIKVLPDMVRAVLTETGPILKASLGDFGENLSRVFDVVVGLGKTLWLLRVPIIALVSAFYLYKASLIGILVVTKTYGVVTGFVKGVMLSYKAAHVGTAIAINGSNAALNAAKIGMIAYTAVAKIAQGITFVFSGAVKLLNLAFIASPIGWIVLGIAALIAIIVLCVKHWDKVSAALARVWAWIKKVSKIIWDALINGLKNLGGWIVEVYQKFGIFLGPIGIMLNMITSIVSKFDLIKDAFSNGGFLAGIKAIGLSIIDGILTPIQTVLELLSRIPGVGKLAGSGAEKIADLRESLFAELKSTANGRSSVAAVAPVSQGERFAYSREESVNTSKMTISLDKGLKSEVSGKAPGITVSSIRSGVR